MPPRVDVVEMYSTADLTGKSWIDTRVVMFHCGFTGSKSVLGLEIGGLQPTG